MRDTDRFDAQAPGTVLIVDDERIVREAMQLLFRSIGLETRGFASAAELLASPFPERPRCIVADVRMPQIGGFELQKRLAARGDATPIIFVTGHGDIAMTVRAMKAGAVDFLAKPFRDQDMVDAISLALDLDRGRRERAEVLAAERRRYQDLSPREREVMHGVVAGRLNKQIAGDLGLSEITVKLHRSKVMRKMAARTVPDLVRVAASLGAAGDEVRAA